MKYSSQIELKIQKRIILWRNIFKYSPNFFGNLIIRTIRNINFFKKADYIVPIFKNKFVSVNIYETTNIYIWAFGVWEPAITRLIEKIVKDNDLFLDIGSHIGYYSILADSLGAKVISVEPSPNLVSKIEKNFRINNIRGEIFKIAISNAKGWTKFYSGQSSNTGKGSLIENWTDYEMSFHVETDKIDAFRKYFDKITIIKIDVEGLENVILEQILENLHEMPNLKYVIFEMHPPEIIKCKNTISSFTRSGFKIFGIENKYSVSFYKKKNFKFEELNENIIQEKFIYSDYILSKNNIKDIFI